MGRTIRGDQQPPRRESEFDEVLADDFDIRGISSYRSCRLTKPGDVFPSEEACTSAPRRVVPAFCNHQTRMADVESTQGGIPCRGPRHAIPSGDEGEPEGDAAGRGQTLDSV